MKITNKTGFDIQYTAAQLEAYDGPVSILSAEVTATYPKDILARLRLAWRVLRGKV